MSNEEAFNILIQIAELYRGTAEEHRKIQEALDVFKGLIASQKTDKSK